MNIGFLLRSDLSDDERKLITLLAVATAATDHTVYGVHSTTMDFFAVTYDAERPPKHVRWIDAGLFTTSDTVVCYISPMTLDRITKADGWGTATTTFIWDQIGLELFTNAALEYAGVLSSKPH